MSSTLGGPARSLAALLTEFGPARDQRVCVQVGEQPLTLSLVTAGHQLRSPLLMMCIDCTINDESARMYVDPALFDACIDGFCLGLSAAALDSALTALIVEAAFADPLDELEKRLGAKIEIKSVEHVRSLPPDWRAPSSSFRVETGEGVSRVVHAELSRAIEGPIMALWSGRVDGDPATDPRLIVAVRAGLVSVSRGELANLAPDDVLLLDESPLYTKELCLLINDRLAARGQLEGRKLTLTEDIMPVDGTADARLSVRQSAGNGARKQDEVTLTVDLVRRSLTASQLLSIDLSKPIDLPKTLEQGIDLYNAGVVVGSGHIVQVGKAIGLRLFMVKSNG